MKRSDDEQDESNSESLADRLDGIRDALDAGDSRPLRQFLDASRDRGLGALARLPFGDYTPPIPEGTRIGDFVFHERLDEGGMGVVYRGMQESVGRVVAIKVMRGQLSPGSYAVRRFSTEVEALARLRHASIVQVLASGAFEDGRPWLAMEYVEGVRLDRWMLGEHPLAERLVLLRRLCLALEHAHSRGVVHRDLKPSNVLVDREGMPHILDFGLARMLDRVTQDSLSGGPNRFVGTLPWMSPEQVNGRTADERSDIHSLGLILYRSVTGEAAYDVDSLELADAMRVLTETSPRPHPLLTGDLEIVTLKALRRNPELRFQRAQDLREEIDRILDHAPVRSRPPTWVEQARELVRRHPGLSGGIAISFVAISSALAVTLAMNARLEQEQRKKEFRIAVHETTIGVNDPDGELVERTALQMLQAGLRAVEETDAEEYGVDEAEILETGSYYAKILVDLGDPATTIPFFHRAVKYVEENDVPVLDRAQAYRNLGFAYHANEEFLLAENYKRAALELRAANLPAYDERVVQSRDELADLLRDTQRFEPAVALLERNVAELERTGDRVRIAKALRSLAATLSAVGQLGRRYDCLAEADALLDLVPAVDLNTRVSVRADLAFVAIDADSIARGRELIEEAMQWTEKQEASASGRIRALIELRCAECLARANDFGLAHSAATKAVETCEMAFGSMHDITREARSELAHICSQLGRCEEARTILEEARESVRATRGTKNMLWRAATRDLVGELTTQGRLREAFQELETIRRSPDDPSPSALAIELDYRVARSDVLRTSGREHELAIELQRALELANQLEPVPGSRVAAAQRAIGGHAIRIGDYDRARQLMTGVEALVTRLAGIDCLPAASARAQIACALLALGRDDEAQPYERSAIATFERIRGPAHRDTLSMKKDIDRFRRIGAARSRGPIPVGRDDR